MDLPRLKHSYDQDGFIRVRQLLGDGELQQVRQELQRFYARIVPSLPPGDRTFEADGRTVRNLWRMEQHDPFFKALGEKPGIRELVGTLVNGEPILMAVETFNKPAKVGSGVPPHQDNAYFCQSPPDMLTVWIAIDAATTDNGPICYLKGSHRDGLIDHRPSGVAGNSMGISKMPPHDASDEFHGTLETGDAMIHHCQTIHWSAPNKSDRARCGLLLVYRGTHTRDDADLRAAYDAARAAKAS